MEDIVTGLTKTPRWQSGRSFAPSLTSEKKRPSQPNEIRTQAGDCLVATWPLTEQGAFRLFTWLIINLSCL